LEPRDGWNPPLGELEEVVGGANDCPFGADVEAAQQELAEAARLFDLPEHRLGQLLAQPGGGFTPPVTVCPSLSVAGAIKRLVFRTRGPECF
jgi:hypothetical protein